MASATLMVPLTAGVAAAAPAGPTPTVVVSGLNNPRQLSIGEYGVMLIAEAGKGGTLATFGSPEEGVQGLGYTGSISEVWQPRYTTNSEPNRILTGLLSAAGPDGSAAVGSDGVSAWQLEHISVQETAFPPAALAGLPGKPRSGQLLSFSQWHPKALRQVADIAGYEQRHNPDGQAVDSDPYGVLQVGNDTLVADAAANDVLKVDRWGHVSTWHVFDNIVNATCLDPSLQQPPPNKPGCQYVPTSLARDRWGHIYVGGLGGLVPGQGTVTELSADGKHVLHRWTGFTAVTGVAVNRGGDVYVSQLFADEAHPLNPAVQGVLTKISCSGHRSNVDVPFPAGVATDGYGNVYVAAFSIAPDTGLNDPGTGKPVPGTSGQVWRLHW
ncbi:MAG TPA: ScyD/ScyE family protein [Jatrophihabitans sp.]|nr:ScyD/ScyE family protein [Jatrophihabitans sp.]